MPPRLAADSRDYAIELSADIQRDPPQIRLNWRTGSDGLGFTVARKAKDSSEWTPLATLPSSAVSYTDSNVRIGVGYDYRVLKDPLPQYGGSGFIHAGIDLPLVEQRGKVVLVVDSTHAQALAPELARLEADLAGDGWTVVRRDVGRDRTPPEVKAIIKAVYDSDPANVEAVFLFGHVPVPYSGNIAPDGHEPDHRGAWPADAYYGDMDGHWSDSSVNNSGAARQANKNVPGDGKFDQDAFPSDIELQVGRVDLANLPGFAPMTELDLLRQYLNKDHNFRHGLLDVPRRALINDNFGSSGGEAFAASGWRNFATFFGSENITSIPGWQYFDKLKQEAYLWSYACGGGAYNSCYYVGGTGDFHFNDVKTVFTFLLGSYFGDWDAENCFLRGPLGSATYGLTAAWAGRPHWFVHHMALGETIGYGTRLTQNGGHHPKHYERSIHIALMGDPTLRMHPVRPPSNVVVARTIAGAALAWAPSPDPAVLGYHIYKAAGAAGPFTRVNQDLIKGTAFVDPAGSGVYMLKAVKLEASASGTYYNSSQGIIAEAGSLPEPPRIPLSITRAAPGGIVITFPTEAGKSYVIETSTNLSSWTPLRTVTAAGSSASVEASNSSPAGFYRVRPQ